MSTHPATDPTVQPDPEDSRTHRPSSEAGASGVVLPERCPGPAGTWPCALPFGHGEDHERFIPEPVLEADNAELRSCLRVALPLLADWPFLRGASLRKALIARIEKALR